MCWLKLHGKSCWELQSFHAEGKAKEETCGERCLWSSVCGRAGLAPHLRTSAPPGAHKRGHRSAEERSRNAGQRVSGPSGGLLGVAGLLLRAGQLYSHHFNKEMIKRGRDVGGGGGRKTQNICFTSNQGRFLCLQGMCKSRRAGRCT